MALNARITINCEPSLKRRVNALARLEGISVNALLTPVIEKLLAEHEAAINDLLSNDYTSGVVVQKLRRKYGFENQLSLFDFIDGTAEDKKTPANDVPVAQETK